jgi:hypothetical protein
LLALLLLTVSLGCGGGGHGSSSSGTGTSGTGTLSIEVTDAPYPYDHLAEAKVVIGEVKVHKTDGATGNGGFETIFSGTKEFDLLKLRGGLTTYLVEDAKLAAGKYDQIRLIVTSASVKLTDGREFDLKVPSGPQSGIKVYPRPPIEVQGGLTADLILDFDVSRSFLPTPASPQKVDDIHGFLFHPVIRIENNSTVGTISGKVYDDNDTISITTDDTPLGNATITAEQGGVVIAQTSSATGDGAYVLQGLPAGTYEVSVEIQGYIDETQQNIDVFVANDTGGIDFRLKKQ